MTLIPRCLSLVDAAAYCGVSSKTLVRHGPPAIRIGTAKVYDIRALDAWIDSLSGAPGAGAGSAAERAMLESLG